MLQVKNVKKTFGTIEALREISFNVDEGEFVFLTGPSGSGKTTLLRLILHDLIPDTGEIIFDGRNIESLKKKEIPSHRREIGVVFQDFKVLPERTVRENIEVALAVIGINHREWYERVDKVLELVGLIDRSHLFPSQLSGGELQRVSLARALVVNPKIILADEPTGNLDWDTSEAIMELFNRINNEGKTIIVATHHKILMEKYNKRVIYLDKGNIKSPEKPKSKKSKKSKE